MRRTVLIVVTLSAAVVLPACRGTQSRSSYTASRTNFPAVAVRFATPPDALTATGDNTEVARASYEGFADSRRGGNTNSEVFHVALWGGPFEGQNVTYGVTSLTPGTYTFALVDQQHTDMVQGWMSIHPEGHDLLSYLQRWKSGIPALKQQLAYDYEITGKMENADPDAFKAFTEQLRAYEQLEQRLNNAINAEASANSRRTRQVRDLFRSAEIRILPGREEVFQPVTRAAFNEEEIQAIHGGGALTKIILVADYDVTQWKLDRVNTLYGDLERVKAVAEQEADRLERRKGLFLLTDHLHDHDQRFVQNEIRLQNTLATIDRINGELHDLRERRMALAFMSELISPDGAFAALDQEEQQCIRERTVLETELARLNQLVAQTGTESPRRVALERSRQRVLTNIGRIDTQIGELFEARDTLVEMVNSSDVIHRQGDDKLLTATFVSTGMPFHIRRAVEREAVMTIRLEARDDVFVPSKATMTAGTFTTGYGFEPSPGPSTSTSNTGGSAATKQVTASRSSQPQGTTTTKPSSGSSAKASKTQQSDPTGWNSTTGTKKNEPTGSNSTTGTKKNEPTGWDSTSGTKKNEPTGWDSTSGTKKNEPTGWDSTSGTKKNEPTGWDSTSGTKKNEPTGWDSTSGTKKNEPTGRDSTTVAKKNEPTGWDSPSSTKKNEPAGWDSKPKTQQNEPTAWNSKPNTQDQEPSGWETKSSKNEPTPGSGGAKSGSPSTTTGTPGTKLAQADSRPVTGKPNPTPVGKNTSATKTYVDAFIQIAPDATNEVGMSHNFTVTVLEDAGDGNGFVPAGGEQVTVTYVALNGAETQSPDSCTTATNGTCTVSVNSETPGKIVATATSKVSVAGLTLLRTTDGTGRNSGPASKTVKTTDTWKSSTPTHDHGSQHQTNVDRSPSSNSSKASPSSKQSKVKKTADQPTPSKSSKPRKARRASDGQSGGDSGCELPFFIKMLVPPCWFLDNHNHGGSSGTQAKKHHGKQNQPEARLTSLPEDGRKQKGTKNKKTSECDCDRILELHGPCLEECCPDGN